MIKLSFHGGTGTVTGANFLLQTDTANILIDCGLVQGRQFCDMSNHQPFPYDPASIDVLLVSHAHLDHTGRIPRLINKGFKGTIYSTQETIDMAKLMLEDSTGIMREEDEACGREALYESKDVAGAFARWKPIAYHKKETIAKGVDVFLKDAGHILGSGIIELTIKEKQKSTKIVFSGDLGNEAAPLLRDAEEVTDADYLIMESVYGDRVHESPAGRRDKLEDIVENTIRSKGALMIPAFSIERTQTLLFELNHLVENGKIPPIPVFLDSPLAIKITELYKRSQLHFNKETKHIIASGDDIFKFPHLSFTCSVEESKAIAHTPNPKIIIAGSGMSTGGRILHHEKRYLSDSASTLLIMGFQGAGTLGRKLLDGAKTVNIFDEEIPVRARVESIFAYSAHKDTDGLVDFAANTAHSVKKVFAVMGEPKSSLFLVQRLRDYVGIDARMPEAGETVILEA